MTPKRAKLLVEKPFPGDSGASKAVVSPDTLDELDWTTGSIVEIRGTESAVATVASSQPGEMEVREIRLDIFTRKSAGVSIGDVVDVEVIEPENVEILVLSIPREMATPKIDSDEIRRRLLGTPVTKDQYVPIGLTQNRPHQSIALPVRETRPGNAVVISEDTEIRLEGEGEPDS